MVSELIDVCDLLSYNPADSLSSVGLPVFVQVCKSVPRLNKSTSLCDPMAYWRRREFERHYFTRLD